MLLFTGAISIAKLDHMIAKYFNGQQSLFLEELKKMVDPPTYETRAVQVDICAHLDQYHKGARVMLQLKEMFKLTGEFTEMKKILESVSALL